LGNFGDVEKKKNSAKGGNNQGEEQFAA
jgi:hypothetical protein